MTGAASSGTRSAPAPGPRPDRGSLTRGTHDLRPGEFGRDGVCGLVTMDRAPRARDVSRPDAEDERLAADVLASLLARIDGRRR